MLQMLRTATAKIATAAAAASAPAKKPSPYQNYMCYQDGRPFMVINAPSLEHAQFIVAGFTQDHTWMLIEMDA
ncbi:MAG TPA: hypothetical protein VL974_01595 [Magnetospirillum sp.]|jgi:hypothetical protein|nr:hypothetical protein [Magnetospirillum sp.]